MENKNKFLLKPHSIITARMNLSPREQDLLALLIISIKKNYDALKFKENEKKEREEIDLTLIPTKYTYTKNEIAGMFCISTSGLIKKDNSPEGDGAYILEKACKGLWDKGIEIRTEKGFILTRLLSHAEYDGKKLVLETTNRMVSEILDCNHKGMGIIDYEILFKLKGKYDKRLLDIISRFKNKRDFECTINELCYMLGTKFDKYESWRIFANAVLVKPIRNIVKVSKGTWEIKDGNGFKIIKKGTKKGYSGCDVISLRMKYISKVVGENEIKIEYKKVLRGELHDMERLNKILDDINVCEINEIKATPEFIKMWSACMFEALKKKRTQ